MKPKSCPKSALISDVCVLKCVYWPVRAIMCFSFVLVFSCLVLSVFSTIPDHQKFANQGLFILVRPPPHSLLHFSHIWLHQHPFSYADLLHTHRTVSVCAYVRVDLFASGGTGSRVSRWEDSGVVDCAGNHRHDPLILIAMLIISPLPLCSSCFSET